MGSQRSRGLQGQRLEEYFFDQPDKVSRLRWEEVGSGILG